MSIFDLLLLSTALGIDCLVVSFSQGLIFKSNKLRNSLNLAFTMGLFQGLMPLIGYLGANSLSKLITPISKQIVFTIFFILGIKFILEAFKKEKETKEYIGFKCLIGLGLATSIDALVSGSTIFLTNSSLIKSVISIGVASFLMSVCGFWLGNKFKQLPSKYLEITGGLILVGLAIKSLF